MKLKSFKFSLLIVLVSILSSCNNYPDGTSEVVVINTIPSTSTRSNGEVYTYYHVVLSDLMDEGEDYRLSPYETSSNVEESFINLVANKANKVSKDSLLLLKVNFDTYKILESSIIAKEDFNDVLIEYNHRAKYKTQPTKEDLDRESSEIKAQLWRLARFIFLILIGIGTFFITPKIFVQIKLLLFRKAMEDELKRRRRIDEREVKSKIMSDLKAKGYREDMIREVYDEMTKNL